MLYRPSLSLTAVRTFSIRAGLAASTVTPGSTAPDVSRTTPVIDWADASDGIITARASRVSSTRRLDALASTGIPSIHRLLRLRTDVGAILQCGLTSHVPGMRSRVRSQVRRVRPLGESAGASG